MTVKVQRTGGNDVMSIFLWVVSRSRSDAVAVEDHLEVPEEKSQQDERACL